MKRDLPLKNYAITYVVAILLAGLSIYIGLPKTGETVGYSELFLLIVVPFIAFFVADKVTTVLEVRGLSASLQDKIVDAKRDLHRSLPIMASISSVGDSREAFEYLINSVRRARAVRNTRLSFSDRDCETSVAGLQRRFDDQMRESLRAGTHYSVVVSHRYAHQLREFREFVREQTPPGQFAGNEIRRGVNPHLNFTILEFPDGECEVLLGWAIAHQRDHQQEVFRIRDSRVASYFVRLHERLMDVVNNDDE